MGWNVIRRELLLAALMALPMELGWRAMPAGKALSPAFGAHGENAPGGRVQAYAARVMADSGDAAMTGALYLASHPEEADLERLAHLVADGRPIPGSDNIGPWLEAGIARELRDGQTVALAGWVFARCEARLCAMIALRTAAA